MDNLTANNVSILAILIGLALGIMCVLASIFVYLKHRKIGVDGVAFLLVGLVFSGLSLFQTISITLGGYNITLDQIRKDIKEDEAVTDLNARKYEDRILELSKEIERIDVSIRKFNDLQSKISNNDDGNDTVIIPIDDDEVPDPIINYRIAQPVDTLIFYKESQRTISEKLLSELRESGFDVGMTETSLEESRKQFPSGSAWIIWREGKRPAVDTVVSILQGVSPATKIEIRPEPYDLRRGDIQVLLF